MSGWQAGDLAVCVESGFTTNQPWKAPEPRVGEVCRVTMVGYGFDGVLELDLDGYGNQGFDAISFRKIRPDEREACEPEFVTLLKRSKREVTAIAAAARQSGDVKQAPGEAPQSGHEVASPKGGSHA